MKNNLALQFYHLNFVPHKGNKSENEIHNSKSRSKDFLSSFETPLLHTSLVTYT